MKNKTYDMLKNAVQVGLPAAGACYYGLAKIWSFPNGEEVVGSLAVIATFLGVLLKISSARYESSGEAYDGDMNVVEDPVTGDRSVNLELKDHPLNLVNGENKVVFKVNRPSS